jgi:hypothetical protein
MLVAATKNKTKTFHATMQVTRLEEWWVEAETPEGARALLETGTGHRCEVGECIHAEVEKPRSGTKSRSKGKPAKPVVHHKTRSRSFRDWAAETTAYANHVIEMALAHQAACCTTPPRGAIVTPIRARGA